MSIIFFEGLIAKLANSSKAAFKYFKIIGLEAIRT
jgi:hypothetical protein